MFQEFREDLAPTTLRVLYGLALTSLVSAAVGGVIVPVAGGKSVSVVWIVAGAALGLAAAGVALGAWLQGRRAPARMYRYSRDLSVLVPMLFEEPAAAGLIHAMLKELRSIIERESGHRVTPMIYSVVPGSVPTLSHSAPGPDVHPPASLTQGGAVASLAVQDEMLREDNLKKRVSKKPDPDLSAFYQIGLKSLRAAPIKLSGRTVGILVVGDDHPRWFGAGDDRLVLLAKAMLSGIWVNGQ